MSIRDQIAWVEDIDGGVDAMIGKELYASARKLGDEFNARAWFGTHRIELDNLKTMEDAKECALDLLDVVQKWGSK